MHQIKFTWRGRQIRESTKQPNKRVAEHMEAAHKAGLAKAEVGVREKKPEPTLREPASASVWLHEALGRGFL